MKFVTRCCPSIRFANVLSFTLAVLSHYVLSCTGLPAAERPNVVFILADDLGIGDVKCYGGNRCQIETPNIDRLASSGIRFTDAHVNASVCVPTRVGIMTGTYPWRFRQPEQGGPWGFLGLRFPDQTFTLGDLFQSAGYQTGYVGKWHLGTRMATHNGAVQNSKTVDFTQPLTVGPPQFGFHSSFILPGSLDMFPYAFVRDNEWQGKVTARKGWSAFNRVGPAEESFEDHKVLETFYGEAETFLSRQSDDDPFFLFLALTAPHTPVSPGEEFQGKSSLGIYGDFVMEVDHGVGRIVRSLKQHGFDQNTLVIFASDHGAAPYAGETAKATPGQLRRLERFNHFSSGPHRGYKFSVYEGGLRIPFIASWPGTTPPAAKCESLIGTNDLMATFAEIVGTTLKADQAVDSISFANLLRKPSSKPERTDLIMQSIGPFVVRQDQWKLCLCPGSGAGGQLGNENGLQEAWSNLLATHGQPRQREELFQAPFVQLYDVAADPHEDRDLAADKPEIVAELIQLLKHEADRETSVPTFHGPQTGSINLLPRVPARVMKGLQN